MRKSRIFCKETVEVRAIAITPISNIALYLRSAWLLARPLPSLLYLNSCNLQQFMGLVERDAFTGMVHHDIVHVSDPVLAEQGAS